MDAVFFSQMRVLGPHDQLLGYVGECRIDIADGSLTHIVLRTPWQTIDLEWDQVYFDDVSDAFRLRPMKR